MDQPAHAVSEHAHVEVDQQPELELGGAEVRQHLRAVHRAQRIDGLQLDNDFRSTIKSAKKSPTDSPRYSIGIGTCVRNGTSRARNSIESARSYTLSSLPGPSSRCTAMAAPMIVPVSSLCSDPAHPPV